MATKFAEFLQTQQIDPRRLAIASRQLERLRPEDRRYRLKKRRSKGEDKKEEKQTPAEKPRSGRPITTQLIARASVGKPVSGSAKTRLLRAVNRILEQKKKDPADLRALF
jgi:hypothetical protein